MHGFGKENNENNDKKNHEIIIIMKPTMAGSKVETETEICYLGMIGNGAKDGNGG